MRALYLSVLDAPHLQVSRIQMRLFIFRPINSRRYDRVSAGVERTAEVGPPLLTPDDLHASWLHTSD